MRTDVDSANSAAALTKMLGQSVRPISLGPDLLAAFEARSLGPANMSGRICDVAVVESKPATMYVASAGGGLDGSRLVAQRGAAVSRATVAPAADGRRNDAG